jgi:hypothetical protein
MDEDSEEEEENPEDRKAEEPIIRIPLDIDSESVNSKRKLELPESVSELEKPESLSLDFSRPFKFSVSPQGLFYLPSPNGVLRGYKLSFENEQAIKGLDVIMSQINYGSRDYFSTPKHLECIWYRMAQIYLRDTTYTNISNEAQVWTLVNVLFGSYFVDVSDMSSMELPSKEGVFDETQVQIMRKKAFFSWLKTWKNDEGVEAGRRILHKLALGQIGQAAAEAVKTGFLYLANLIALTPTEYTRTELQYQIEQWKNSNVFQSFTPNLAEIYEVLAGIFTKLPDSFDWKQKLSLILQYKSLSYHNITQVINEFLNSCSESSNLKSRFNQDYEDFCYLLIRFYSNPSHFFTPQLLNPYGFQSHFSVGISWLLFYSLYSIFEVSEEYRNINNERIRFVFDQLEFLTEAFAEELVNNEKWQLAVFVLKFSKKPSTIVRKIIARNTHINDCPIDSECISEFLPQIELARALHERQSFNFMKAFNGYLESGNIGLASDIVIHELAPLYIIKYKGKTLYSRLYENVLEKIFEKSIEENRIVLEEEIYIDYLNIVLKKYQKWRPEDEESLSKALAEVDMVNMKILRLPRGSFNQQRAISIMQTLLNKWKLKLLQVKNMMSGIVEAEFLNNVSECNNEDLLRFAELIGEVYLKSEVRV